MIRMGANDTDSVKHSDGAEALLVSQDPPRENANRSIEENVSEPASNMTVPETPFYADSTVPDFLQCT